jgi:hypothetical protein
MFARLLNRLAARPSARRPRFCRSLPLRLEVLEDRTLLTGHVLSDAALLPFTPKGAATVAGFLAAPAQIDLYQISLHSGDTTTASVAAQSTGSGLNAPAIRSRRTTTSTAVIRS